MEEIWRFLLFLIGILLFTLKVDRLCLRKGTMLQGQWVYPLFMVQESADCQVQ